MAFVRRFRLASGVNVPLVRALTQEPPFRRQHSSPRWSGRWAL